MNNDAQIKQLVKEKYSEIANQPKELNAASCCGATSAAKLAYGSELAMVDAAACTVPAPGVPAGTSAPLSM